MKKLLFAFAIVGLAIASAKSYNVTLFQPSNVGDTELQPGNYKLELNEQTVTLRNNKQSVSAPVKVETGEKKNVSTTVRYSNGDGKYRIQEIRLGGTNMKLVLN